VQDAESSRTIKKSRRADHEHDGGLVLMQQNRIAVEPNNPNWKILYKKSDGDVLLK